MACHRPRLKPGYDFDEAPLFIISAISATFLFIACKKSADNNPNPDPVAAVLNLPATPFNYANITQPAYLNAPNILGQINTPPEIRSLIMAPLWDACCFTIKPIH
ncbi:MAG: hypothetical protein IPI68_12805 [Chitinophagaceae bacterium]|nr:hypothetical protein [Chitinophagaceae bacterium]